MDHIKHKMAYGSQKEYYSNFDQQQYYVLENLCKTSKELYNLALYNIKNYHMQYKRFLDYEGNLKICAKNRFFMSLHTDQAKHVVMRVNKDFCSYFKSSKKEREINSGKTVRPPQYKAKNEYFEVVVYNPRVVGKEFVLPLSESSKKRFGMSSMKLPIPAHLLDQNREITEIRIRPKKQAEVFEFEYIYVLNESLLYGADLPKTIHVLFGYRDLYAICVDNKYTFAIDGKFLFNTHASYSSQIQSISNAHQKLKLAEESNDMVYDYLIKASDFIMHYALEHGISHINLVAGPLLSTNFHASVYAQLGYKLETMCSKRDMRYTENLDVNFDIGDINFDQMSIVDPLSYKNKAFVHLTNMIDN